MSQLYQLLGENLKAENVISEKLSLNNEHDFAKYALCKVLVIYII